MSGKTPVSLLQELCIQKQQDLHYELIADGTGEQSKTFVYHVEAFGFKQTGEGKSKKDAKHEAAANIISILKTIPEFEKDLNEVPQVPRQIVDIDAVGTLLDICVQREWPLATFTVQQASGAPHAPEFTYECRIASLARVGTFSTKKGAKQIAAQQMLRVVQNMMSREDEHKKQLDKTYTSEPPEKLMRTYREYKNSDIKYSEGVLLRNRHKFFLKFDDAKKAIAREIIFSNETPKERVYMLCRKLDFKFELTYVPNHSAGKYMLFEMFGDYDVCIGNTEPFIYQEIIRYFATMFGFINSQKYLNFI